MSLASPIVHDQGFWLSHEEGHFFDAALAAELELLLRGRSVCDLGCGPGRYVRHLRSAGIACDGYDGNPNTPKLTGGICASLDLAAPIEIAQYDAVVSLEVGEHIPRSKEAIFFDNLTRCARDMIVLSWAVPHQEGDGHINCRSNSHVIRQMWRRDFQFDAEKSAMLRTHSSLMWFKRTLMVFSRRSANLPAIPYRILSQDVDHMRHDNRSNSSFSEAMLGKTVRTLSPVVTSAVNLMRRQTMRLQEPPAKLREADARGIGFYPVFFTCAKHFRYVRLALLSLARLGIPIKKVFLYVDRADPFSEIEGAAIRVDHGGQLLPIAMRNTRHDMSWGGAKVILNEMIAYREIVSQMTADDYLVKIDSDVLFVNKGAFDFVAENEPDAFGTRPYYRKDSYMQGGCYFIKGASLERIVNARIEPTVSACANGNLDEVAEDFVISELLKQSGARLDFGDFLHFDANFVASGADKAVLQATLDSLPLSASVIHFEGDSSGRTDKSNMRTVAELLMGELPENPNPYIRRVLVPPPV